MKKSSTIDSLPLDFIADQKNYITILKSENGNQIESSVPIVYEPANFCVENKSDEVLEAETRGIDVKGNVRWFCPKCNCRYIEFKYLKTHLKECGFIYKCSECQQKFKQKRTFVAHVKKKHAAAASDSKPEIILSM